MPTPKVIQSTSSLPPNEKTFTIDLVGDTTKAVSKGQFTCRCVLNLAQRAEADLVEARLNQGFKGIRDATQTYHYVLSQLYERITKAPEWWIKSALPGEDVPGKLLMDWNIVSKIFEECMTAEGDWRVAVWGNEEPPKPPIEPSESEGETAPKVG